MRKIIYLVLAATLVFSGCKKDELSGGIYGVITDKATGEPIRNAGVQLNPLGTKTVTGSEGQYEFTEL
ncbi:MAG: carboxypeptidase-like regulatory domain-containing protein, partial [Bacteroidales bacterium]|nr:carboxypeptidase-like regulatory domain-containing protein [Bacteroidales bacterium]